jgi:hypothetical protein
VLILLLDGLAIASDRPLILSKSACQRCDTSVADNLVRLTDLQTGGNNQILVPDLGSVLQDDLVRAWLEALGLGLDLGDVRGDERAQRSSEVSLGRKT